MARATKEQSQETARQLRTVAAGLFAEHGYAAIGLERVASAAGVTRGAIYHHWKNKRELFAAVLADAQESVGSAVAQAAPGDGWDAIEAGCVAFLRAAIGPDVRRILLVEAPAVLGWQEWRRGDAEHAGRMLEEGLRAMPDLTVDASAAAALLGGAMNEAALWIAEGGDARAAEDGIRALLSGLRDRS